MKTWQYTELKDHSVILSLEVAHDYTSLGCIMKAFIKHDVENQLAK